MAGVEVVGLVLGAVPLLISGMEHYGEGVRTIKRMRNAADEFVKLKTILKVECQIFENDLQSILQGEVDDCLLPLLLKDRTHPYWSNPGLERCLERRLGQSHGAYIQIVKSIDQGIAELMECLKLSDYDGKAPFNEKDKKSVIATLSKIKFGLRMKKYEELVGEITLNSQRLNRLIATTKLSAPMDVTKRKSPDFEQDRQYAVSLFRVLQSRLLSSCSLTHTASLHMRPAEGPNARKELESLNARRLRVVFDHRPVKECQAVPSWITEEAEIQPLDDSSDADSDSGSSPSYSRQGGVRFAVINPAAKPTLPPHRRRRQRPPKIEDLCASLHLLQATCQPRYDANDDSGVEEACFGYLSDDHRRRHRHGLYRPAKPFVSVLNTSGKSNAHPITLRLAEVLDPRGTYRLSEIDKKYLALALASGMLRLHHTPWLDEQWGRHDVVLFRRGRGLVASHPFISVEITKSVAAAATAEAITAAVTAASSASSNATATAAVTATASGASARMKYFRPCRLIKEQTLFALGILLIELALECPFDSLITGEDLNPDGTKHELTDFYTADRLVGEIYLVAGERYGAAVRRCIRCDFDQKDISLMSAEFRRKVYEGVVAQLQLDIEDILCI